MTSTATPTRPDPFALTEEERSVRDTAREFAQRELAPTAAQRDEEERYDRALFTRMGELGLTAIPYPEELGGAGLSYFAWALACVVARPASETDSGSASAAPRSVRRRGWKRRAKRPAVAVMKVLLEIRGSPRRLGNCVWRASRLPAA